MPRNQLAAGAAMGWCVRALAIAQWCDRQGLGFGHFASRRPRRSTPPAAAGRLARQRSGAIRRDPGAIRGEPRRSAAIPERSRRDRAATAADRADRAARRDGCPAYGELRRIADDQLAAEADDADVASAARPPEHQAGSDPERSGAIRRPIQYHTHL